MKKSLILAGMLCIGYANAQYDGKVGINNETPKATLDINATATNLAGTTNEGIIAPRLTKQRIADIATNKLTEGTLVYATDTTYTTGTDTTKDARVALITEKGYYFYNNTQWVKMETEWIYDASTKRSNLKRSGSGDFKNKVFYDAQTGQYIDTDSETEIQDTKYSDATGYSDENVSLKSLSMAKHINFSLSNNLKTMTSSGSTFKGLGYKRINISNDDNTGNFRGDHLDMLIPTGNSQNYSTIYGDIAFTSLYGSGTITSNIAQWGQLVIGNQQKISSYATGILGSTAVRTSEKINNLYGSYSRNILVSPSAAITILAAGNFENSHLANDNTLVTNSIGIRNMNLNNSQNTGTGTLLTGIFNRVDQKGKTKYPNMYGIYSATFIDGTAVAPTNLYGLYITDVKGAETINRAIHTNAGKIRFGDLADTSATTDRQVMVDKDGVLKVGSAVATTSTNGVQSQSDMACTSANAGKINYTTKEINGEQKGIFGFCMQKGSEYVWAYMVGGANIFGTSANGAAFGDGL